jgi:hypothetical protein
MSHALQTCIRNAGLHDCRRNAVPKPIARAVRPTTDETETAGNEGQAFTPDMSCEDSLSVSFPAEAARVKSRPLNPPP